MKKKIIVGSIIVSIFLIGIVAASFLTYFGRITGSATVEGPTFYIAPDNTLLINEEPITHDIYNIEDGNAIIFWTEENLDGIDFSYIPKVDLYVRAKVNNATPPKSLELIFGYSDTSNIMQEICFLQVDISTEEWDDYHISCDGSFIPEDVNEFYYKMQGKGGQGIEYSINTENTKVKIIGVV